jgi:hypothetical protein
MILGTVLLAGGVVALGAAAWSRRAAESARARG